MSQLGLTPIQRFWRLVNKTPTCWTWKAHLNPRTRRGYLQVGKRCIAIHRFAYENLVGPIPEGLCVCHSCDNPSCVNPKHLFLGTQEDNMADMVAKGRVNRPMGELNGRAKLTTDIVRYIRQNYKFRSKTHGQKQLAAMFGVCVLTIQEVLDRRKWSHVA